MEKAGFDLGRRSLGTAAAGGDDPLAAIAVPTEARLHLVERALHAGHDVEAVAAASRHRPVVRGPDRARSSRRRAALGGRPLSTLRAADLASAKRLGLSDARLAALTGATEAAVRRHRDALGVAPVFKTVDTCAGEFPARTPVPLLDVRGGDRGRARRAAAGGDPRRRSEPHRPGDRVRLRLRARGVRARGGGIRVRDGELEPRDGLHRLRHVEPPVLRAALARGRAGRVPRGATGRRDRAARRPDAAAARATCSQRGGVHGPRHIARRDRPRGGPRQVRARSSPSSRSRRRRTARRARSTEAREIAGRIGYPGRRAARPTCSADGRWRSSTTTTSSRRSSAPPPRRRPTIRCSIDRFLEGAIEVDVDAVCDGTGDVFIGGVMEHIEEAGVHSGDSSCQIPPATLSDDELDTIEDITRRLARRLGRRRPAEPAARGEGRADLGDRSQSRGRRARCRSSRR